MRELLPQTLNSMWLKIIAGACMLVDHICMILYPYSDLAVMLRLTVGRIAMPIYIFLICEGFFKTKSRKKYALSLLITAIISEPIYDMAKAGVLMDFRFQNVCFTLLSGLLMLCLLNYFSIHGQRILQLLTIVGFSFMSSYLHFSYGSSAIISFALLFYLHWHYNYIKGAAVSAVLAILDNTPGALIAILPIGMYNDQRGRLSTAGKYFFYIFYPLHLLIIVLIKYFFM